MAFTSSRPLQYAPAAPAQPQSPYTPPPPATPTYATTPYGTNQTTTTPYPGPVDPKYGFQSTTPRTTTTQQPPLPFMTQKPKQQQQRQKNIQSTTTKQQKQQQTKKSGAQQVLVQQQQKQVQKKNPTQSLTQKLPQPQQQQQQEQQQNVFNMSTRGIKKIIPATPDVLRNINIQYANNNVHSPVAVHIHGERVLEVPEQTIVKMMNHKNNKVVQYRVPEGFSTRAFLVRLKSKNGKPKFVLFFRHLYTANGERVDLPVELAIDC